LPNFRRLASSLFPTSLLSPKRKRPVKKVVRNFLSQISASFAICVRGVGKWKGFYLHRFLFHVQGVFWYGMV
jgi:hypothetical protein